jgi:hypothetical protein
MTLPPPHVISRRAAIRALFTVSHEEAVGLHAIVKSSESSEQEKQKARNDLTALSSSTMARLAEIQEASETKVEGRRETSAVRAPLLEMPSAAEESDEAQAA